MTFLQRFSATFSFFLALVISLWTVPAMAETTQDNVRFVKTQNARTDDGYTSREIIDAGHTFFGGTTRGLAQAVEYVFQKAGRPKGYIIGEEGSGAFIGGLRYGEGKLFLKTGHKQKIFWQGPSIGFDFGGNGSRVLVLVYHINHESDLYDRFPGVEGSAYFIGGLGVNFQANEKLVLAPIRTGIGARLGANIGYLKYSARPTLNPF